MKNSIGIMITILMVMFLITGCERNEGKSFENNIKVAYLGNLASNVDNDNLKIVFSLFENGEFITKDGTILVTIVNDMNDTVYKNSFAVAKTDFVVDTGMYSLKDTPSLSYELEIPLEDIKNSTSSNGVVYLEFNDGSHFTKIRKTTTYGLPTISDADLLKMNKAEFLKISKALDQSVTSDDVKITLTRGGFFTPKTNSGNGCYGCANAPKEYYVVELVIENIDTSATQFYTSNIALMDDANNQYEVTSDYVLQSPSGTSYSAIFPGIKKTMLYAFSDVPKDVQLKLLFEKGFDNNGTPVLYKLAAN